MTLSRQYVPPVGKSVKMRQFSDYTSRDINVWAWIRVTAINSDGVTVQVLNGTAPTSQFAHIPFAAIAPPVGWSPRYTIHVSPDKVETVLSWFARGIVVRQSHDMSGSMPTAFQPMDNSAQPHWQFCEVTDAIPAEQCASIFRIVKTETQEINFVYNPDCPHCSGSGRRTLAELAVIRSQSIAKLKELMAIPAEPYRVNDGLHLDAYDEQTETFDCACRYGFFRQLGRSKRAKLIKEWAKLGWETHYVPYAGGYWERTRETVVKDWE